MKTAEKVKYLRARGWRVDRGLSKSFGSPALLDPVLTKERGREYQAIRDVGDAYRIQVRREARRLVRLGAHFRDAPTSVTKTRLPAGWVHSLWNGRVSRETALATLEAVVRRLKSRITVELRTEEK